MAAATASKVFPFRDSRAVPDPVLELSPECLHPSPVPIVIDNGSFQTRAGWGCGGDRFAEPRLIFKSVAARSRGAARSETQIGNDIPNLEPLRWLLKSQFDRNVVVNFEIQELMFDYVFMHLGISTEGCVEHPVVLTESPCNPLHSRQMMSELLFECYRVPRVSYGVDSLYSYYHNTTKRGLDPPSTGLIISSGYHCSHVLPVLNGRLDARNCKRINVGGSHSAAYLQRLLQLKYPGHLAAITLSRMEETLHQHCYIAQDYQQELDRWRCGEFYEKEVHRLQLPFSQKLLSSTLSAEERLERRSQQLRRLQELNARRREEKLQLDQERLERLLSVQELLEDGLLEQFHKALVELNMDSAEELLSYINKLSLAVEQSKHKILQAEGSVEVEVVDIKPETPDLEQTLDESELEPEFSEDHTEVEKPANPVQPMFNLAEYHQLFLGTERLRVPEIIFQPSMIGEEQAGIVETVQYVLDRYPKEQQGALVQNVLLTGGNLMYPGMRERLERELLAIRPFQSHFQVRMASNPVLDAWYGARDWALMCTDQEEGWITRSDYEEKGGEYLKEHCASNTFVPMSIAKQTPKAPEPAPAPVPAPIAPSTPITG
ncbi:actin-related protein 5-like [Acipenser oxyrinchus oxyrinchus]|uniref:Actin-related protein 5 n=1 Tax=Acipenser oxyrinchus oxyrinchus TaxID=40147 RepID=A0AAD8CS85_ACIOX|nr:actin-related protein 5-like [Acipenser oxyrinchus oxyrinchus]